MATARFRPPSAATLPTVGTPGDLVAKTGTGAGLYVCVSTNTYTVPLTPSGSPTTGNLAKFSSATTVTNADLTGDVTTSGGVATTIANNAVTDAKFRQSAACSVPGRSANTAGNVADITASVNGTVLKRTANALAFAAVDLAADVTGVTPIANGGIGATTFSGAGLVRAIDLKQTIIAGGTAGSLTVTGVAVGDQLVAVTRFVGAGIAVTDVSNITNEFTISGPNAINNAGGTNTTGDKLAVWWVDLT